MSVSPNGIALRLCVRPVRVLIQKSLHLRGIGCRPSSIPVLSCNISLWRGSGNSRGRHAGPLQGNRLAWVKGSGDLPSPGAFRDPQALGAGANHGRKDAGAVGPANERAIRTNLDASRRTPQFELCILGNQP